MGSHIVFGSGACDTSCFLPPPSLEGCGPCCEPCCAPCRIAPCKTRLRDARRMKPREVERGFFLHEFGCNSEMMPLMVDRVGLVLRRRGACCEIACLAPIRITLDGEAVFRWPEKFLRGPAGQYEGDLILNGCEVGSILLIKPAPAVVIEDGDVTQADFGCVSDECSACGFGPASCRCGVVCGDYAEPDGFPEDNAAVCGGCDAC